MGEYDCNAKIYFTDNKWVNGKIFMLKTGKTYDASVKMKDVNTLQLTGYAFLPIFRESAIFTRCQGAQKNMLLESVKKLNYRICFVCHLR